MEGADWLAQVASMRHLGSRKHTGGWAHARCGHAWLMRERAWRQAQTMERGWRWQDGEGIEDWDRGVGLGSRIRIRILGLGLGF